MASVSDSASPLLIDGLGALFLAVLFFGVWITYRTSRPAALGYSDKWKSATSVAEPTPAAAEAPPSPVRRALVAYVGGALLAAGAMMPGSLLVQSAAVATAPFGVAVYIGCA